MRRQFAALTITFAAVVTLFGIVPVVYYTNTNEVYGTVTNFQDSFYNNANVTVVYHGQTVYAEVRCDVYQKGSTFPLFYHPALLYMGNSSLFSDEVRLQAGC